MKERFSGDDGRRKLVEAILEQPVIGGDRALAEKLISAGHVVTFKAGETLTQQHADDDDVFFIINGKVDVFVNHQCVGTRESTIVGEMVAIAPTAKRSATLKAQAEVTVLRVSAGDFVDAGKRSIPFWRHLAHLAGDRLREREKFHLPANQTPILFIGCSLEGLPIANEIQASLKMAHDVIARPWTTHGVFNPSEFTIDELVRQANEADFALFVFGPDDKISHRGEEYMTPRDNVVFEMGLFIGRLGRDRVFMVKDHDADLKIPSDLLGLKAITYKCKPGCSTADVVGPVYLELIKAISARGVVANRLRIA